MQGRAEEKGRGGVRRGGEGREERSVLHLEEECKAGQKRSGGEGRGGER